MRVGAMFARRIKRRSRSFLCFMGTKKTDSNKLFQIHQKIALTEAKLIHSVVHVSKDGRKNSSSNTGAVSGLMRELVNKLNGAYVLLATT